MALAAHWMLHNDTKIFWGREQAEAKLRSSVDILMSWSGGSEQATRLTWVNEVHGTCTVLAKTAGEGTETRRWWVIFEVHVPSVDGTRVLGPWRCRQMEWAVETSLKEPAQRRSS